MGIKFKPKSYVGKLSVGLIVIMPILFYSGMSLVSFYGTVPAGRTILHDIIIRPGVALPMIAGFVSGIAAFFCSIFSITRKKDYSVLVFISLIVSFFVLLWVLSHFL